MEYGFRRPVAAAIGAEGHTYSMPVSGLPNYGTAGAYRGFFDTVSYFLNQLPNIFYMAHGLHNRMPRIKKTAIWVQTTPKRGKEPNKKGKKGKGRCRVNQLMSSFVDSAFVRFASSVGKAY